MIVGDSAEGQLGIARYKPGSSPPEPRKSVFIVNGNKKSKCIKRPRVKSSINTRRHTCRADDDGHHDVTFSGIY
jgi:hypothetical protein